MTISTLTATALGLLLPWVFLDGASCNGAPMRKTQEQINMEPGNIHPVSNISAMARVLLEMKAKLNDPRNSLGNWSLWTQGAPCNWAGVNCKISENGRVITELRLSNMSLIGSVPTVMCRISTLTRFDISFNKLHGSLPQEIFNSVCANLVYINLTSNSMLNGSLPQLINVTLPNLTHLDLSQNSFSGPLTPNFINSAFPNLFHLDLSQNSFSGLLPELALLNLHHLDLYNNSFSGPLPNLKLPNLRYLDLAYNKFTGSIPSSYGHSLPHILSLSLHHNQLNAGTCFPIALSNLSELQILALAWNPFPPSTLPPEIGLLHNLTYLWLSNCSLYGSIPYFLSKLTRLETFDLANNQLNGPIPDFITFSFPRLQYLQLWNNSLSGNVPLSIGNVSQLSQIDLSYNNLSGPLPSSMSDLHDLTLLKLTQNHFLNGSLPHGLGKLPLIELSIRGNSFEGEFPQELGLNGRLQMLDISDNHFRGPLPPYVCHNGDLIYLITMNNEFEGSIPTDYGNCISLKRIRMSSNHLEGIVPSGLWQIPSLEILDLANNSLRGEIPDTILHSVVLTSFIISNNKFTGNVPLELGKIPNLSKIHANDNQLSGSIPSTFGLLSMLDDLQLQANALTGAIPPELGNCTNLFNLNLSHNLLTNHIPPSLGSIPSLNFLDLSHNRLNGTIPPSLRNVLQRLNLSENHLTGPIPRNLLLNQDDVGAFVDNPDLCFDDNPDGPSSRISPVGVKSCQTSVKSKVFHHDEIILSISIALAVVITAVALLVRSFLSNSSGLKSRLSRASAEVENIPEPLWICFQRLTAEEQVELQKWTPPKAVDLIPKYCNNDWPSSILIGDGSSGKVYRTTLSSGKVVAIKHLSSFHHCQLSHNGGFLKLEHTADNKSTEMGGGFKAEIETLGRVQHSNIVKLLCCYTNNVDRSLLVYEYMKNGSLKDALHGNSRDQATSMRINEPSVRYNIAKGIAQAMTYLHHECKPPIVHRDLKSGNILLDSEFEAHLGDFGIARVLHETSATQLFTTNIVGTPGYMAPEYCRGMRKATEKGDVYSFGVVMLELVTGKPAILCNAKQTGEEGTESDENGRAEQITDWVRRMCRKRAEGKRRGSDKEGKKGEEEGMWEEEMWDARMVMDGEMDVQKMRMLLSVGLHCTNPDAGRRPTMRSVAERLLLLLLVPL